MTSLIGGGLINAPDVSGLSALNSARSGPGLTDTRKPLQRSAGLNGASDANRVGGVVHAFYKRGDDLELTDQAAKRARNLVA